MKAVFELNGKAIGNEKIEDVSLLIILGEDFKENDWRWNENYVIKQLEEECNIFDMDEFNIECPYEDLVYFSNCSFTGVGEVGYYPSNPDELAKLVASYLEAVKVFGDRVRVSVHSNYLYENGNEDDFSLEEFLNNFKLM